MNKADLIIKNGWILTLDDETHTYPEGFVAIAGDRIAAVGPAIDAADWEAERQIDARGGLVMPGLVNAHTHAAMTCFRGLADDLPLMQWLNEHIFPAEAALITPPNVRAAVRLACAELLLAGVTTCCDGYFLEDTVAEVVAEMGLRAVLGQGVIDALENGVSQVEEVKGRFPQDCLQRLDD